MSETPKQSLSDDDIVTDAVPGNQPATDADGVDGGGKDGDSTDVKDGDGTDGGDADGADA